MYKSSFPCEFRLILDWFPLVMCLSCAEIRTFEVLLRTYEVKEVKMNTSSMVVESHEEDNGGMPPCKRKHRSNEDDPISLDKSSNATSVVMARPCSEARGHTGYLTFARLQCLA